MLADESLLASNVWGNFYLLTKLFFTLNCAHNTLYWSPYSMNGTTVRNCNSKLSVNVWCVIFLNAPIGRHVCEGDLTGPLYLRFLQSAPQLLLRRVFCSGPMS